MYTNGGYALVQLVTGQVIMMSGAHHHVQVVMAQAKNDIELNKHL